jgi:hypothetical protein
MDSHHDNLFLIIGYSINKIYIYKRILYYKMQVMKITGLYQLMINFIDKLNDH